MKITLLQLAVMQEARRREVMNRLLSGVPRPKPNPKPVTAKLLEAKRKAVSTEFERAIKAMTDQWVDTLVFGMAVTKVDARGRHTRVDPRSLRHVRRPFPILWKWRRPRKLVYGRSPVMEALEDVSKFTGLQRRMSYTPTPEEQKAKDGILKTFPMTDVYPLRWEQHAADPPISAEAKPGQDLQNVGGILTPIRPPSPKGSVQHWAHRWDDIQRELSD